MAEIKHTPEPWIYAQDFDENGKRAKVTTVAMCGEFVIGLPSNIEGGNYRDAPFGDSESDARRIVACVNSCAGVHTEQLEQMRFSLPVAYREMRQQRDDLREALIVITNHLERIGDTRLHKDGQFIEDARAVIAKATGSNV